MKRIDVNVRDNDGWTPAMAAAFWVQIPCLELLARNGADLEMKNKDNKTLLGEQMNVIYERYLSADVRREWRASVC